MSQEPHPIEIDGIVPQETDALFLSKHLAAYVFARKFIAHKTTVEIGFGEGYGSAYLAQEAAHVTAIDIAPGNAERAAQTYRHENLEFKTVSGLHYDFADASFDSACSFQVIEHIPENDLIVHLEEIKRILKPGGFYFVSTLNLENAMKPGVAYEKLHCHEKEFTASELKALLEQVFERVEMHGLFYGPKLCMAQRFKKWGFLKLGAPERNPLVRYYQTITPQEYVSRPYVTSQATDLLALAYKAAAPNDSTTN